MKYEQWRDIPGVPYYQASNWGRLRTLDKRVRCKNGTRTIKGRILTPTVCKQTGYHQITINRKTTSAHRLIALTWVPGFAEGLWIDHLNGVRTDNRPDNLEWVTPSENARRPYALGRRKSPTLGKFSGEHNTSKAVIATNMLTGIEREFASAMDAVREGFDSSSISRCCRNIYHYHKGHTWRFKKPLELIETRRRGFMDERNAA